MHGRPTCRKSQIPITNNFFWSLLIIILLFTSHGCCKSAVYKGYRLTLAVPVEYSVGFIGRAFLMETEQIVPNFKAALSVEAVNGRFACSIEVFLGDFKVWNSGHYSRFYVSEKCVLELTENGDLHLMGPNERIGWKTGTSGQGVERLKIMKTGNLVLVDSLNRVKWQSFNFPTDVMLWGQRLNVATRLTSFPSNSTAFYSFEIQRDRIGLFLHSGNWNYSYWEFKPSKNRNISFVALATNAVEIFNDKGKKIAQVSLQRLHPLRFLALGNKTGNLGVYYYSANEENFQASFHAINTTCDLPLACKPCAICTSSNACSSIGVLKKKEKTNSDCGVGGGGGVADGFCGGGWDDQVEMLEIQGVSSVLRNAHKMVNISKDKCADLCMNDCKCVAALYASDEMECSVYGLIMGVKQVEKGSGLSYMVKVPKGTQKNHGKSNVKKWVLILVGVVDGLIILLVFGGLAYYLIRKRKRELLLAATNNNTT
ncbi:hypothetical protein Q3G72_004947 [Acer saccharum]|nr:hypothetical protein Q3G72_004947 [Acer saccharum]